MTSFTSISTMSIIIAASAAGLSAAATLIGIANKWLHESAKPAGSMETESRPAVEIQIDGKTIDLSSMNTKDRREIESLIKKLQVDA